MNIFQQSVFENTAVGVAETQEQRGGARKKDQGLIEIEIAAKRAFPDYNFDVYEGRRTTNRLLAEEQEDGKAARNEDGELSEEEEVRDAELMLLNERSQKKPVFLERSESIQKSREKLPIFFREGEITEHIDENLVTLICGATGSGKSTQVPQFLYEAGYGAPLECNPGLVAVTQPRRLAAISLAKRVSEEMGCALGREVVYQVRHDASAHSAEHTRIKFMTDGILLNEMTSDFLLHRYSVIIIDEAHERKVNTDLLLGLLSRVVHIRKRLALEERDKPRAERRYFPLRLVIMSATLRIEDFTQNKYLLPQKIKVINVEARQFPVNIYFNKRTPDDYLAEAVRKCVKIHTQLPPGDVLVFLTGEREIKEFCVTLEAHLAQRQRSHAHEPEGDFGAGDFELLSEGENEDADEDAPKREAPGSDAFRLIAHDPLVSEGLLGQKRAARKALHFRVLPLYSKLSAEDQDAVFRQRDPDTRIIIAATNVAETSLTIPNIKYVVDTGKQKLKVYSQTTSLTRHVIAWTSQASADQRTGRSGRTQPGYCYRLYAPSVFANVFQQFSDPEILHMPLESVILRLKAAGIRDVLAFPYPTRPKQTLMLRALNALHRIGALDYAEDDAEEYEEREDSRAQDTSALNDLGRVLAVLPIDPKFGKMILQGRQAALLGHVLLLVGYLSVEELFNRDRFRVRDGARDEDSAAEEDEDEENADILVQKERLQLLEQQQRAQRAQAERRRQENAQFKAHFDGYVQGKSDLFVGMNLLGEFFEQTAHAGFGQLDAAIARFALEKGLLSKSLREIHQNLEQLLEIVRALLNDAREAALIENFFRSAYARPLPREILTLQEILVSTFADKVARKVMLTTAEGRKQIAYESCENTYEYIHLSPQSFLFATKPAYVTYTSIMATSK